MLHKLLATANDPAPLIARLMLGFVMFPHGAQHALGWFGGYGFSRTFGWMTETLGFPAPLAAIGIVTELVAPSRSCLAWVGGSLRSGSSGSWSAPPVRTSRTASS